MPEFSFDADKHEYTFNGKRVESVTQVIESRHFCDPWYKERGRHVHTMCELYKQDMLDEDALDPQLRPYLDALKLFELEAPDVSGIGDYKSGQFEKWHLLQCGAYRELWIHGIDEHGEPLRKITKGYEVKGYHPVYNYAGTIDLIDIRDTNRAPDAFALYLKDNGKYKIEPVRDVRIHTLKFLTLVSAGYIREEYGINN